MGTKGKGIVLGKERSESIEDLRPSADKNKDVKNTTMKGSEGEVAIRRTKEMTLTDEREKKKIWVKDGKGNAEVYAKIEKKMNGKDKYCKKGRERRQKKGTGRQGELEMTC